jgi:protein-S-isoprenylcysteine O-methyltransferase Ste14
MKIIIRRVAAHYLINLAIFGMFFAIYALHSYYADLLRDETLTVFRFLFASYLILGIPYYFLRFRFFTTEADYSKDKLIVLRDFIFHKNRSPEISAAAKTAVLSYIVKFFFLPLMLNFFFFHSQTFLSLWREMDTSQSFYDFFWRSGYHLIFNLIFIIDTVVFAFAYTFEFRFLRNRIKSVDPFVSGWVVALICYPPFSSSADNFILLLKNSAWLSDGWLFDALKVGILLAFGVYVWATLALGFKASNLTNRGIVSRGPYRFVRHPAYIAKNLAWWLEFLPFLNFGLLISLLAWNLIYFLRAMTEERHLSADPDYQAYKKKVKWKFIPGVY